MRALFAAASREPWGVSSALTPSALAGLCRSIGESGSFSSTSEWLIRPCRWQLVRTGLHLMPALGHKLMGVLG